MEGNIAVRGKGEGRMKMREGKRKWEKGRRRQSKYEGGCGKRR